MTELRIRVKDVIKEELESIKTKTGLGLNFQVNFAIYKYLILDAKIPLWKLDDRIDPHYETINKLPEDSCEIPSDFKGTWKEDLMQMVIANKEGDKC